MQSLNKHDFIAGANVTFAEGEMLLFACACAQLFKFQSYTRLHLRPLVRLRLCSQYMQIPFVGVINYVIRPQYMYFDISGY